MDKAGLDTGDVALDRRAQSPCFLEACVLLRGEWGQKDNK